MFENPRSCRPGIFFSNNAILYRLYELMMGVFLFF